MFYRDEQEFKSSCGYEYDGQWYPRVTKIIEIKAKPALYRFYGELSSFAEGEEIKIRSANEGTLIHETFEKILMGQSPTIDPSIAPAIKAAVNFLNFNAIKVDPEYVEQRIVNHEHRYSGTIDSLALIGGRFGILDIKTSQSIYRDYNLQTAAYFDALKNQLKGLQTRWILRIDQVKKCLKCGSTLRPKGGREKIRKPYPLPDGLIICQVDGIQGHQWSELTGVVELKEFPFWQEDFAGFLAAKSLWEWENSFWLRKIGYL